MKPTLMGHPFIMISKVNTISMLEDMGLKYRYDFWNHSYNDIENDYERMDGVKQFTKQVMKLSKRELKQFKEDYNNYSKDNFNILTNEIYPNSIKKEKLSPEITCWVGILAKSRFAPYGGLPMM